MSHGISVEALKNFISPTRWKLLLPVLLVFLSVSSVAVFQASAPGAEENLDQGLELRKYVVSESILLARFDDTNQTEKFEKLLQIIEKNPEYDGSGISSYGASTSVLLEDKPVLMGAAIWGIAADQVHSGYPYPCYLGEDPNSYVGSRCDLYVDEGKVDAYLNPDTSRLVLEFADENNLSLSDSYRQKIDSTDFGTPMYLRQDQFIQELEGVEPFQAHRLLIHLFYIFALGYLVSSLFIYLEHKLLQFRDR